MALVYAPSSVAVGAPKTTILLVDDDPFQANAHRLALERHFPNIERVTGASEAFIRLGEPEFQETLALILVGLRLPGVGSPAIVSELRSRLPHVPVLVIGRRGETATDYTSEKVGFLPSGSPGSELLAAVRKVLAARLRQVA